MRAARQDLGESAVVNGIWASPSNIEVSGHNAAPNHARNWPVQKTEISRGINWLSVSARFLHFSPSIQWLTLTKMQKVSRLSGGLRSSDTE